ncbi:polyhydroxyalkanoate depolymerase [Paracoccus suum]|uniref:Polyhydroxyalkanoate depolymerase n=1 Tax=Paracoccus suum TaxID=2259340 RepID=A0A344PPC4_9RHOB|nr:polyhydroxyalkanoate depolymerase [Paracoccus suum]AXC51229.1 polyhydroxyalkanoate depolymerase [Paracoccus suum]
MARYDAMEAARNTSEWMGASARALGSYPAFALAPVPMFKMLAAWGAVTERSFARMAIKPDWNLPPIIGPEGQDHIVYVEPRLRRPFGDLVHFRVARREPMTRRILLVAPMSGHYATLLRSTVASLLPDAEVYITDWHNARDIPVSEGKFDVEDYTRYLTDFIADLAADGPINVVAVCQPAPLALAATALLADEAPELLPRSLILIGGPIDPDAKATEVTDFGNRITMGELEHLVIQQVGFKHRGAGRMVYPGLAQLTSFIAMNAATHTKAFTDQIFAEARGDATPYDRHNKFYDEYLAVMDMTAEFYLSTVGRIFKGLELAHNRFTVEGKPVDLGRIRDTWVMTVEGAEDDISAPGQCVAALELCSGLPAERKAQHLEPGAGHYGIFAGKSWRLNIRPLVLDFMDEAAGTKAPRRRKRASASAVAASADAPSPSRKLAV